MTKLQLSLVACLVPCGLALTAGSILMPASAGAPVSSTGAPNEKTCATAECHDTYTLNTGTATSSLAIEGNPEQYTPGKTYAVTISVQDKDVQRFGYQLVVLRNSDNSNAGSLSLVDTVNTQIIANDVTLMDRRYATYTYPGTAAKESGLGRWTVQWTAPVTDEGPVTFYLATVSANNDDTDKGDYAYTQKKVLTSPLSTSLLNAHSNTAHNFRIVPNPAVGATTLFFTLLRPSTVEFAIADLQGRQLFSVQPENFAEGEQTRTLDISSLAAGQYTLRYTINNMLFAKTLIVQ